MIDILDVGNTAAAADLILMWTMESSVAGFRAADTQSRVVTITSRGTCGLFIPYIFLVRRGPRRVVRLAAEAGLGRTQTRL